MGQIALRPTSILAGRRIVISAGGIFEFRKCFELIFARPRQQHILGADLERCPRNRYELAAHPKEATYRQYRIKHFISPPD